MIGRIGVLVAAGLALTACASSSPYGPARGPGDSGYIDQRVDPARYVVTFQGNASMDPSLVYEYALLRAAEVTLDSDYGWFYIVSRDQTGDAMRGDPRRHSRYGDFDRYYDSSRYAVSLEIVMGYGRRPPKDPNAFDARDLERDLRRLK
jgi:hypothetical protein